MNNTAAVHIKEILGNVLAEMQSESDSKMLEIWDNWEKIAGRDIAQNTKPSAFRDKILWIDIVDSAWMHRITFLKSRMIEQINKFAGQEAVDDLRFRIG